MDKKFIYIDFEKESGGALDYNFWISSKVEHPKLFTHDNKAPYFKIIAPTLAEIVSAYYGKQKDGNFISNEFREVWGSEIHLPEWTSSYLKNETELIENPESFEYNIKTKTWDIHGGKISKVELPFPGWVLEFDKSTGLPSRTSTKREDAYNIFGDDASHFEYPTRFESDPKLNPNFTWAWGADRTQQYVSDLKEGIRPITVNYSPGCSDSNFRIDILGPGIDYLTAFPNGVDTRISLRDLKKERRQTLEQTKYFIPNFKQFVKWQNYVAFRRGEKSRDFR